MCSGSFLGFALVHFRVAPWALGAASVACSAGFGGIRLWPSGWGEFFWGVSESLQAHPVWGWLLFFFVAAAVRNQLPVVLLHIFIMCATVF